MVTMLFATNVTTSCGAVTLAHTLSFSSVIDNWDKSSSTINDCSKRVWSSASCSRKVEGAALHDESGVFQNIFGMTPSFKRLFGSFWLSNFLFRLLCWSVNLPWSSRNKVSKISNLALDLHVSISPLVSNHSMAHNENDATTRLLTTSTTKRWPLLRLMIDWCDEWSILIQWYRSDSYSMKCS